MSPLPSPLPQGVRAALAARLVALPDGALAHADHPEVLALALECAMAGYGLGELYLMAARHAWRAAQNGGADATISRGADDLRLRFARLTARLREALIAEALTLTAEAGGAPRAAIAMPHAGWRRDAAVYERDRSLYQRRPGEPEALRWARAT